MTTEEMNAKVLDRAKELLTMPEVQEIYQSKPTEKEAKDWLLHSALFTLMYSHEERVEMLLNKTN
uniref:hypothetical protein n=1 Tax=Yoonia sp. TaxID=2212373 RepID=UPI004047851A